MSDPRAVPSRSGSVLKPYRVRCENCNWTGYKQLPARSALTLVDRPCGRCKHPAVFALSPKVSR